jgi:hypothetical protein
MTLLVLPIVVPSSRRRIILVAKSVFNPRYKYQTILTKAMLEYTDSITSDLKQKSIYHGHLIFMPGTYKK